MKGKPKPRFNTGDTVYYISGSEVAQAKVTGNLWIMTGWTYDCTEKPDFFYLTDDEAYDSKSAALRELKTQLSRKISFIRKQLNIVKNELAITEIKISKNDAS